MLYLNNMRSLVTVTRIAIAVMGLGALYLGLVVALVTENLAWDMAFRRLAAEQAGQYLWEVRLDSAAMAWRNGGLPAVALGIVPIVAIVVLIVALITLWRMTTALRSSAGEELGSPRNSRSHLTRLLLTVLGIASFAVLLYLVLAITWYRPLWQGFGFALSPTYLVSVILIAVGAGIAMLLNYLIGVHVREAQYRNELSAVI